MDHLRVISKRQKEEQNVVKIKCGECKEVYDNQKKLDDHKPCEGLSRDQKIKWLLNKILELENKLNDYIKKGGTKRG